MDPLQVSVLAAQMCARVPGGTGRYTEELVRALAAATPQDASLSALAPRGCAAAERLPVRTSTLPLPAGLLSRLWERGWPPHAARSGVVHAPTLLVPPARRGCALVVTVHDVVPWTHPETLTPRGVAFHRRMGARAARDADVIVTDTAAVADRVRELLAPRGRVVSAHLGVTVSPVPDDAATRRSAVGVGRDYVLFVGTAEPRKGLDVLVAALAEPALADLDLVVVGPAGWGDVSVADLAAKAGVGGRVVVTGRVGEADLQALYAGARMVAVPSRAEGFGLPLVEAMGHGIPVVTSDDPALVEVGGGVAAVTPVGDAPALAAALAEAAAEGPARALRVEEGIRRAAEFSWAGTAAAMWDVYRSVS